MELCYQHRKQKVAVPSEPKTPPAKKHDDQKGPVTSTPRPHSASGKPTKTALQSEDAKKQTDRPTSLFTKEYTYTVEDGLEEGKRPYSPKEHGFTYVANKDGGKGGVSPISKHEEGATSPSSKQGTALAFAYHPPGSEEVTKGKKSPEPAASGKDKATKAKKEKVALQSKANAAPVATGKDSAEPEGAKKKDKDTKKEGSKKKPEKDKKKDKEKDPPPKKKEKKGILGRGKDKDKEKDKAKEEAKDTTTDKKADKKESTDKGKSKKGVADKAGEAARPSSRTAHLDSSSSSVSVSSDSSLDEYATESVLEKEVAGADPILLSPLGGGSGSGSSPLPGGRVTKVTRKKVVMQPDGTVEEIEEIIEPSTAASPLSKEAPSNKPVVVGVVPTAKGESVSSTKVFIFDNLAFML